MPIEAIASDIDALTEADISDGLALVAEAGWNQVEADWRYMLREGRGYGVREGGRLIASSVVLFYPPRIGWIGMVLVNTPHRQRGHATRLLKNAIEVISARGLVPMLDATPAGREVYLRLGFSDGEPIERWRGDGRGRDRVASSEDIGAAAEMDAEALGVDRAALLNNLLSRERAPVFARKDGVLLGRRGRTATQLGPLLAHSADAAVSLCSEAIAVLSGPLLIDVPVRETALGELLRASGFAVERPFTRMALGGSAAIGESMRAIAGPELG